MSYASDTLPSHLLDVESLDVLAEENFGTDSALVVIPNEAARALTKWCVGYYFDSGRRQAPTREALQERWGDVIEAEEIDLGDGTQNDTIEYLIAQLRIQHQRVEAQKLVRATGMATAQADDDELGDAVKQAARQWYELQRSTESRRKSQDGPQGIEDALTRYLGRKNSGLAVHGLSFGLAPIDEHLHGIHPGEVCTIAAETGVGKSWMAVMTLFHEFDQGRRCVLFTLENDLPMTFDRVISMGAHVDYERWQESTLTGPEVERFDKLYDKVMSSDKHFRVEMPPRGERNVAAMVRKALALGADSIIIDQLTFIEAVGKHSKKSDDIYEIMHDLKEMVSEGAEKIPVLLLHQINRDGAQHSRKTGVYLPEHMSYGSEVERTTDFLFAIYQSEFDRRCTEAQFQLIKSRRTKKCRWQSSFDVGCGDIQIRHVVSEDDVADDRSLEDAL